MQINNAESRLYIILRICFALRKDIEINLIQKCEASRGFKDKLSFLQNSFRILCSFCKYILSFHRVHFSKRRCVKLYSLFR